jgi:hypothetical protein
MYKNTAGKWAVYAYGAPDHATLAGLPVTGDAANITGTIYIDGVSNAIDDTNPTELGGGYYEFDVTAAETNGASLLMVASSSTADVIVVGVPGAVYTQDTTATVASAVTTDMDANSTQLAAIAGYLDTEIAALQADVTAILADTNELQGDITDGGRVDLLIDAIKAKTDQMIFTITNQIDANIQSINDVTITGDGQVGTEFGV